MSVEELRPSRAIAARCGRHAMATKDAADGGGRDSMSQLEQLALDAAVAPTRVLAAQTQDQVPQLVRDRRPAGTRAQAEGRPTLAHQLLMPAEQRGGREEQAPRRQSQAQYSQDHSVGWQQLRSLNLSAQDGDLVAEGENLEVALGV